jgi:hypothetical protein
MLTEVLYTMIAALIRTRAATIRVNRFERGDWERTLREWPNSVPF